jgi:hypothetical protein
LKNGKRIADAMPDELPQRIAVVIHRADALFHRFAALVLIALAVGFPRIEERERIRVDGRDAQPSLCSLTNAITGSAFKPGPDRNREDECHSRKQDPHEPEIEKPASNGGIEHR